MIQNTAFDTNQYIALQRDTIIKRLQNFTGDRMYLEVGGKLLFDGHASRVLPGFDPTSKIRILKELIKSADVIFCINYEDILYNREISLTQSNYITEVLKILKDIKNYLSITPFITINKFPKKSDLELPSRISNFLLELKSLGYKVFKRFEIPGYPQNIDVIISDRGFGGDEYVPVSKKLVIVTGIASNSGKLSTALGQIYLDKLKYQDSGYMKYETFPIWNLPLNHPVNLAYEAATADIGDFNLIDTEHFKSYGVSAINYNRDLEAFNLLKTLGSKFVSPTNIIHSYKSPTDMGINNAGFCIKDDLAVCLASHKEIIDRLESYISLYKNKESLKSAIKKTEKLAKQSYQYIKEKYLDDSSREL